LTSLGKVAYGTKIEDGFQGVIEQMEKFLVMAIAAITVSLLSRRFRNILLTVEKVIYVHDRSCIGSRYRMRGIPLTGME